MNELVFKQITQPDAETLGTIARWMYDWWGKDDGYTLEAMECFVKSSMQSTRLPHTYGAFCGERVVGVFQFTYEDLTVRPDIYPWFANLYVDPEFRGKGVGAYLLENASRAARENLSYDRIYLYTTHVGLYEKFGWKYASELDTYTKAPRMQRLYTLDLE